MANKAIIVKTGGGYDKVVVSGILGPKEPRIPMADGADEVIAVGEDVSEFSMAISW